MPKTAKEFICENCDFKCYKNSNYLKHLDTAKHKNQHFVNTNQQTLCQEVLYNCICGKKYKERSGLWRHKKTCTYKPEENNLEHSLKAMLQPLEEKLLAIENEKILAIQNSIASNSSNNNNDISLLPEIIKQGQEFQMQMFQQMMEFMKNANNTITTNSHNTNNNYTQFNLQVYLNETCKNAMNIDKFLDYLQPTVEELEATAQLGYVEGISRIIMRGFKNLEEHELPFHCTDLKREHIYVKNPDDEWVEEKDEKPLLLLFVKEVARKNFNNINEWQKKNPNWASYHSKQNDMFMKILNNSVSGGTEEEQQANYEKIMKNIMKNTVIDRSKKNSK